MESSEFVDIMCNEKVPNYIKHFAMEIHILCRIVNVRFFYVGWAARIFFIGILGIFVSLSVAFYYQTV